MPTSGTAKTLRVAIEKRILNEFGSKILNEERLEQVSESRKTSRLTPHSNVPFHCECDDGECEEIIQISIEEYEELHRKTRHFLVVPSHVRFDIEEIITSFQNYALVGKFFPHSAA